MYPTTVTGDREIVRLMLEDASLKARLREANGAASDSSRIWYSKDAVPAQNGIRALQHDLRAVVSQADFSSSSTQRDVRSWLGDFGPRVRLSGTMDYVIANKSRLSLPWLQPFETREGPSWVFHGTDHDSIQTFLYQAGVFQHLSTNTGMYVRVPLRASLSVIIFEPKRSANIADIGSYLFSVLNNHAVYNSQAVYTALSFPKFRVAIQGAEQLQILRNVARTIGLPQLTTSRAPSSILQSSEVCFDERGVSTSTITVAIRYRAIRGGAMTLRIDHPFIFAIRDDRSNKFLYAGIVQDLSHG